MSKMYYEVSDLLSTTSGIIVHGCNAVGVMGAGVARAIKDNYPDCYDKYIDTLETIIANINIRDGETVPGNVIWWSDGGKNGKEELIIANAITQDSFSDGRNTDYEAVDKVFDQVFQMADVMGFTEIHIPLIGAGIGGGCWAVIEQIILDRAHNFNSLKDEKSETVNVVVHCLMENDIPDWVTDYKVVN